MALHLDIITDNVGFLANGYANTILISVVNICVGFILGTVLAAGRMSPVRLLSAASTTYIEVVRACPLLMVIFWVYFALPVMVGFAPDPFVSVLVALTGYRAALMAEVVRSGIRAVHPGQVEAAFALSLSRARTWTSIILPQALVNMLPALTNQAVATVKASSLAYVVGVMDLTRAGHVVMSREFAPYEVLATVALTYLLTSLVISAAGAALWQRLRLRTGRLD